MLCLCSCACYYADSSIRQLAPRPHTELTGTRGPTAGANAKAEPARSLCEPIARAMPESHAELQIRRNPTDSTNILPERGMSLCEPECMHKEKSPCEGGSRLVVAVGYAADLDIKSLYVTAPKVPSVVVFSAPASSTYLITSLASTA